MADSQKLMNPEGDVVDFLEKRYEKPYYRIETDTHYIDRMDSAIEGIQREVTKLKEKERFRDADIIAEGFVRSACRNKAIFKKMSRNDYLESQRRSWKIFKEKIFGYDQLTEKEKVADQSDNE